ncbi:hypothetical protein TNCV_352091 [Trichonephila clavipes]|nr:hypothetical protein TNCV_352091 [Trichonephila clavipes]
MVKFCFRLRSPKNWEFRICQLAICDNRRPCIGQGLSPYATITHPVKRWHSVYPVCRALTIQENDSPHGSHIKRKIICLPPDHPSGKGVLRDLHYTTTPTFTG